jgi:SRSO17 transposase
MVGELNVRQMHQSLHHVVADAPWSDDALLEQVRRQVLPAMTKKHMLGGWTVDDTGFPRRELIPSESRASIAVSWAGRITAEWR